MCTLLKHQRKGASPTDATHVQLNNTDPKFFDEMNKQTPASFSPKQNKNERHHLELRGCVRGGDVHISCPPALSPSHGRHAKKEASVPSCWTSLQASEREHPADSVNLPGSGRRCLKETPFELPRGRGGRRDGRDGRRNPIHAAATDCGGASGRVRRQRHAHGCVLCVLSSAFTLLYSSPLFKNIKFSFPRHPPPPKLPPLTRSTTLLCPCTHIRAEQSATSGTA